MRGKILAIVVVVRHRELEGRFVGPADPGMQVGRVLGAVHVADAFAEVIQQAGDAGVVE